MMRLTCLLLALLLFGTAQQVSALTLSATASSQAAAGLAPANAVDGNAVTFWSSGAHGSAAAQEWIIVDLGQVVNVTGLKLTPRRADGQTLGFPRDYYVDYSYDEAGQHWFRLNGSAIADAPVPSATVTHQYTAKVLARRIRVTATELGPDEFSNFYFQLGEIEPVVGSTVFPFETSNGPYYDAQLNMLWTVYGSFLDSTGPADRATLDFGNEPAWHEWLGLKYGWNTQTRNKLAELRNGRIAPWPQSGDGYIWSWGSQERWPTGDQSYHQENNAKYILGAWRIWSWSRDDSFFDQVDPTNAGSAPRADVSQGRTVREKLRAAMGYIEESLQGNLGGIQIEDNGMDNTGEPDAEATNYWDNWPFGYYNAYDNIYYYMALEAMAQMENYWGDTARAEQLRARRETMRQDYMAKFWDSAKGRFIACIDKSGDRRDFGGTFHNLEALAYGLGDQEKATSIFDWLDGRRILAGETSTGADIYHWKFAPRANTIKIESVGPPYWWYSLNGAIRVDGNARWDMHLENGGAIFYTSYYDLMARLRWMGADDAEQRLNAILDDFAIDQLRRNPNVWQLGIIGVFPESGLVPCALVYGFAGIEPDAEGLHVQPRLPSQWEYLTVRQVNYAGRILTITVRHDSITVVNAFSSAGTIYAGTQAISLGSSRTVPNEGNQGLILSLEPREDPISTRAAHWGPYAQK